MEGTYFAEANVPFNVPFKMKSGRCHPIRNDKTTDHTKVSYLTDIGWFSGVRLESWMFFSFSKGDW